VSAMSTVPVWMIETLFAFAAGLLAGRVKASKSAILIVGLGFLLVAIIFEPIFYPEVNPAGLIATNSIIMAYLFLGYIFGRRRA